MNMKKTLAFALCCAVFVCTASAQDDDLWGDYDSSTPAEISEPDPAPGWEPLSDFDEQPAADKPVKTAKTKPEKQPKPQKAPAAKASKPAKEPRQRAEPVGGDDRTLNFFVNAGGGLGIGAHLVGEVDKIGTLNDKNNDYFMNLGQGFKFEVGAGYMLMPNVEARFSADLNFGLFAPEFEKKQPDPMDAAQFDVYTTKYTYFSWEIKAMAVPSFEVLEMFDMYLGTGLSLNFAYATRDSTYNNNIDKNFNEVYDLKFSPAVGFCGVAGLVFPMSDAMDFVGELQFESKSFTIKKQELKTESPDKDDHYPPSDIVYEKNTASETRTPNAQLRYSGSNWGIRVGIRYWFAL